MKTTKKFKCKNIKKHWIRKIKKAGQILQNFQLIYTYIYLFLLCFRKTCDVLRKWCVCMGTLQTSSSGENPNSPGISLTHTHTHTHTPTQAQVLVDSLRLFSLRFADDGFLRGASPCHATPCEFRDLNASRRHQSVPEVRQCLAVEFLYKLLMLS